MRRFLEVRSRVRCGRRCANLFERMHRRMKILFAIGLMRVMGMLQRVSGRWIPLMGQRVFCAGINMRWHWHSLIAVR